MKTRTLALIAGAALGAACSGSDTSAPTTGATTVSLSNAKLNLLVMRGADGRVTGQWTEEVARGARITVTANCLAMSGSQAWVSGVISESQMPRLKGMDAIVRVDASGSTSYTVMGTGGTCRGAPPIPLMVKTGDTRVSLR